MLPTNNWIPTVLDDDRFPVLDIALPEPIIGRYLDFAKNEPTTELKSIPMSTITSGELNTTTGFVGRDDEFRATLEAKLMLGSVYGSVMIDRMNVPAVRGISSGSRGELPSG